MTEEVKLVLTLEEKRFLQAATKSLKATEQNTKGMKNWASSAANLNQGLELLKKGLNVATQAARALTQVTSTAISTAIEFENQSRAFNVVFRDMGDAAEESAQRLSDAFGLSLIEARKFQIDIGDLAVPMGVAREEALKLSESLSGLAVDAATFRGVKAEDALRAFQSGLTGVTMPLKKFGIVMTEAKVEAVALREGMIQQGETMTEAQKVMARAIVIQEGLADASGAYARAVGTAQRATAEFESNVEDLNTVIGLALTDTFAQITDQINVIILQMKDWAITNKEVISQAFINGLVAIIDGFSFLVTVISKLTQTFFAAKAIFNGFMSAAVSGVATLVNAFTGLSREVEIIFLAIAENVAESLRKILFLAAEIGNKFKGDIGKNLNIAANKALLFEGNIRNAKKSVEEFTESELAVSLGHISEGFRKTGEDAVGSIASMQQFADKAVEVSDTLKTTILASGAASSGEEGADGGGSEAPSGGEGEGAAKTGLPMIDAAMDGTLEEASENYMTFFEALRNEQALTTDEAKKWDDVVNNNLVSSFNKLGDGVADVFMKGIKGTQSLSEGFKQLGKSILEDAIKSLIKMGTQFLINAAIGAIFGKGQVMAASGMAFANTFASIAAIPIIGPFLAPAAAAAAKAAVLAGGAIPGAANGVDFVPNDMLANIHQGERVVPGETNKDLTRFLERQESSGTMGGGATVTVNVENFIGEDEFVDELALKISDSIELRNQDFRG
jgi:hypothetical protein